MASTRAQSLVPSKGRVDPSGRTCTSSPLALRLALIVALSFTFARLSCGNQSRRVAPFGVDHGEESPADLADFHEALLVIFRITAKPFDLVGIFEDRCGFMELYAMLAPIRR